MPRRAGAAPRKVCAAGPSITQGRWVGSNSLNIMARVEGTYRDF